MRINRNARAGWLLFSGLLLAGSVRADVKHDFLLELALSGNRDDNAFRTAKDETSANFASVSLDSRYKHDFNTLVRLIAELDAERDDYESSVDNADATDSHARLGARFTPLKRGWRWLRVTPTVFFDDTDKVFNSRETGDEISGAQDRFDYQQTGVDLELEFRSSRKFETGMRFQAKQKDYDEDFSDDLLTDSLDYDEQRAQAYVTWRKERSTYTLAAEYRDREYDEKFPRASDGTEVLPFFPPGASEKPYEPSRYTYLIGDFQWRRELSATWSLTSAYEWTDRTDEFLSYMDYESQDFDVRLLGDIAQRWKFYGSVSYEDIQYDNARVNFTPGEQLKRVAYTRLVARVTYALREATALFASYRIDDEYHRDPTFEYTRQRFGLGVSHRFF